MKIIDTNIEDKKIVYRMTHSDSMKPSDRIGEVVAVNAWALVEDTDKKTGTTREVLFIDSDCGVFGTISETFKSAFMDIVETFGSDFHNIEFVGGTSKNGRNFVSCNLVD